MFSGKRYLLIGFVLSVLLSLFINFRLIVHTYEKVSGGRTATIFLPQPEGYHLYFPLLWFFFFSFVLFILTIQLYKLGECLFGKKEYKTLCFVIGINMIIACALIWFHPLIRWAVEEGIFNIEQPRPQERVLFMKELPRKQSALAFPRPLVTEHLFAFITIILSVVLMRLLNSRHQIALEFEKLKIEKLQNSYNALMGQVNPHFFFNSLNGLNSLIRSGKQEQTLKYLDELSNIFRYILQSNRKELVTLAEELQFVKAYTYLLSVRYEGKLFFSIHAEPACLLCYLPILSVLPLVENAVKHNIISKHYPLQVDIYTNQDNQLIVSNQVQPKTEEGNSNGIGLQNLWGRYKMLTGKDIHISRYKGYFQVILPLLNSPVKS